MPVEAHLQLEAAEQKAAGAGQGKTRRFWYPTVLLNLDVKKIINVFGEEIKTKKNTPLFYIFDDGTVEKKIIIE